MPYGLDEEAHRIPTDNDKRIAAKLLTGWLPTIKLKTFPTNCGPKQVQMRFARYGAEDILLCLV